MAQGGSGQILVAMRGSLLPILDRRPRFFAVKRYQGVNLHSVVFARWQQNHRRRFESSGRFLLQDATNAHREKYSVECTKVLSNCSDLECRWRSLSDGTVE